MLEEKKIEGEKLKALRAASMDLMHAQLDLVEKQLKRDRLVTDAIGDLGLDPFLNTINSDTGIVAKRK